MYGLVLFSLDDHFTMRPSTPCDFHKTCLMESKKQQKYFDSLEPDKQSPRCTSDNSSVIISLQARHIILPSLLYRSGFIVPWERVGDSKLGREKQSSYRLAG